MISLPKIESSRRDLSTAQFSAHFAVFSLSSIIAIRSAVSTFVPRPCGRVQDPVAFFGTFFCKSQGLQFSRSENCKCAWNGFGYIDSTVFGRRSDAVLTLFDQCVDMAVAMQLLCPKNWYCTVPQGLGGKVETAVRIAMML